MINKSAETPQKINFKRKINPMIAAQKAEKFETKVLYSNFKPRINHKNNSFVISVFTAKNSHLGLIDTGADSTIMHINNLPENIEISESLAQIREASGDKLKIIGRASEFEIIVGCRKMRISPFITVVQPKYTILGFEDILRTPGCLTVILDKKKTISHSINVINYREIVDMFDDIFKEEIDNKSVCTFGQHAINTGNSSPIAVRNHRVPVYWEKNR